MVQHPNIVAFHRFCELVFELGADYEASVSSWGRTLRHNAAVGGHPKSWHLWERGALAADLVFDNAQVATKAAEVAREWGLEIELADDHLHVEMDLRSWQGETNVSAVPTILGQSVSKTADQRDATKPMPGALRDAAIAALGGWAAAAVLAKSGSPELAHAADAALQGWIPQILGVVFGGFTLFRKSVVTAIAR